MSLIINWIVSAVVIVVAAMLIPGINVDWIGAFLLAVVLGLINAFLRPLINLITLPINVLTLGLFSLVVNALIIMVAGMVVPGFTVDGFWPAFFFAILVSLITALFGAWKR